MTHRFLPLLAILALTAGPSFSEGAHAVDQEGAIRSDADAAKTAVINKRAGGMGLISGRKAFQRPMSEGVELLNTIQDVYLDESIAVA